MDDLEETYREFEKFSQQHEPLTAAGVMMAQALVIYKTILSPEEFTALTEHVLNSRDSVQALEQPTLQ